MGDPTDRHAVAVDALRQAVFQSPGSTQLSIRIAAGRGGELPEPLAAYAAKVRDQSYHITDADFAGLTAAGLSDDAIFEIEELRPSAHPGPRGASRAVVLDSG